jgi:hypothetical protein
VKSIAEADFSDPPSAAIIAEVRTTTSRAATRLEGESFARPARGNYGKKEKRKRKKKKERVGVSLVWKFGEPWLLSTLLASLVRTPAPEGNKVYSFRGEGARLSPAPRTKGSLGDVKSVIKRRLTM